MAWDPAQLITLHNEIDKRVLSVSFWTWEKRDGPIIPTSLVPLEIIKIFNYKIIFKSIV